MAASSGPAPTADSLVHHGALAKVTLRTDPKGFQVFCRKFDSALGTHYQKVIKYAVATNNLEPVDARAAELHGKIYDMLVGTFADAHDDILLDMEAHANALGPKALVWLKARYSSGDLPTALNGMMSILNGVLGHDTVVADITGLITRNANAARLRIPDELLCALVLMKLPSDFNNVRDNVIFDDQLPSLAELLGKVQAAVNFKPALLAGAGQMAFAGVGTQSGTQRLFCFNCDTVGHVLATCGQPKHKCDECGAKGHMAKYCFVRNDKPLPSNMSRETKTTIEAKRVAYKARMAATAMACVDISALDDASYYAVVESPSFLEVLAQQC